MRRYVAMSSAISAVSMRSIFVTTTIAGKDASAAAR